MLRLTIVLLSGFLIVGGHQGPFCSRGFISGESFRLRPAVNRVVIGFFIFMLRSGFTPFTLLWDGWLARKTLTRGIN